MVVKEIFYVGYSDIDANLKLSDTAILKFFENMACIHGTRAGESIKTCEARWFLTAYEVKILKRPEYEDTVTVHTWSRDMRGVSASREFEIYNSNGELCVIGLSNWARVNAFTQKLERATPAVAAAYQSEKERTNFPYAWAPKLSEPAEYITSQDFTVTRNFIDANHHMNNVFYLDLAKLLLPDEVYDNTDFSEFKIMYRQAIKYGETVTCAYGVCGDRHIVTLKGDDGEIRAIMELVK
jgi:acyl-ACP thioesterase